MPATAAPTPDTSATLPPKPLLRGWLHAGMAPLSLVLGLVLMTVAPTITSRVGLAIYVVTAVTMFGNSAIYHRFSWTPDIKRLFRRLDHSFIFVFIAGTYTPLCLTLLHGWSRISLLAVVWTCAAAGLLFRVLWLRAPRALYTALYVVMGWAAVGWMVPLWNAGGPAVVVLLVLGGLVYTAGAVVYGRKRPDPWPAVFGFHEIFHGCTVVAALFHYAAIVAAIVVAA